MGMLDRAIKALVEQEVDRALKDYESYVMRRFQECKYNPSQRPAVDFIRLYASVEDFKKPY